MPSNAYDKKTIANIVIGQPIVLLVASKRRKIAINPRKILELEDASIEEGNKANITLFDPTVSWKFTNKMIKSKSNNTPFIGEELIGKALAIYNNGKLKEC